MLIEYLRQQKPNGEESLEPSWEDKTLRDMHHSQTGEAEIRNSYQGMDNYTIKDMKD